MLYKILWKWCKVGNGENQYGMCKENLKKLWTTIPRMDKWEIPNLVTICYIKLSILEVAFLVTGLD